LINHPPSTIHRPPFTFHYVLMQDVRIKSSIFAESDTGKM
jgi:hypothetical protein